MGVVSECFYLLQSFTALTATQRDLGEFVNVLHQDTSTAVTSAATTIKGLLATVSAFMCVPPIQHNQINHSLKAERNLCWKLPIYAGLCPW